MDVNVVKLKQMREISDNVCIRFKRQLHVTSDLIVRLGLDTELEGHNGCVNCLEWNERGNILASGSDDLHIILWDPFSHKRLKTFQSGHHGNIFTVKFLPGSNDGIVASGAADCKIRVHDVCEGETTMACSCPNGRVKRLAVVPNSPFLFWSASEDGLVMQYDLRVPHQCSSACNNVLINLSNHLGRNAEAKCIAINPSRPHLLAVGANDPYVRLYDRRMLSPMTVRHQSETGIRPPWERHAYTPSAAVAKDDNLPIGCVTYFVAGHLPLKQNDYKKKYRTLTSTYLVFSPDGAEILANLGGEQIYLFDILHPREHKTFESYSFPVFRGGGEELQSTAKIETVEASLQSNGFISNNGVTHGHIFYNISTAKSLHEATRVKEKRHYGNVLPMRVEKIKKKANEHFDRQEYTIAISLYNKGIMLCPSGAYLYGNRAAAYMKRGWDGDIYAALRDCSFALKLDPDYLKAHFRLARCLFEIHWTSEASKCLQAFKAKYPEYSQTHAFTSLDKDIKASLKAENGNDDCSSNHISLSESKSTSSTNLSSPRHSRLVFSEKEKMWQSSAYDYELRFCGHCNTTTDIKEANFFGTNGQYIVAGSDDGSFFIWDRFTTNIVRVLRGDDSIVNCLQPHPTCCILATSGIDPVVRLWAPKPQDGSKEDREIIDSEDAAIANQKRMNADPLEVMLMNMGYRIPGVFDAEEVDSEGSETNLVQCRQS